MKKSSTKNKHQNIRKNREDGSKPTFKNFADALKRSGLQPSEVMRKFRSGEIMIEPFSRHKMGLVGSVKIGRYVESAFYNGAKSVTLTADDVRKIYKMPIGKIG